MAGTMEFDRVRSEAFAGRLLDTLDSAGLAMMLSIGHKTGLFDTMATMTPATAAEIAERAELVERYVREWLNAMTAGRVVEFDPSTGRYSLPPEHAAFLTRAATPNNIAVTMQLVSVLGEVENKIAERFRVGGGLAYGEYTCFHEAMAEDSAQTVVAALEEHILPLVPGLEARLKSGIRVLDVGCGRGRAMIHLAGLFPQSEFIGYDLCEDATAWGGAEAARLGLGNVRIEARDVTELGIEQEIDLVTAFDAIHDQARPDLVLRGIRRALRPGGVFLMQDIGGSSFVEKNLDRPLATFVYTVSCMHCMSVSLAQGGMGLGAAWGEEKALEMLAAAGFPEVERRRLEHDIMNVYYVARTG